MAGEEELYHNELLKLIRGLVESFVKGYRVNLAQTRGTLPPIQLPPAGGGSGSGGGGSPGGVVLENDDPEDVSTAPDPGDNSTAARGDHVHALPVTGVTPATYGDGTNVAVITVDAYGRITSASESAITGTGAPDDATYITQTPSSGLSAEQALSALASGLLKNTTATGVLTIATPGTDYAEASHTHAATGAGGQEPFFVDGVLTALTDVAGAFISPTAQSIEKVMIRCGTPGSSGSTVVDVNRNGGSIFPTTTKPTLAGGAWAQAIPDIVDLYEGDIVTFDIDSVRTGAASLSILLVLATALSNIPPQGALDGDKIGTNTDNIVLSLGTSGQWDDEKILHPCAVEYGGTIYLYYGAYDGSKWQIGVATAPVGGFTGVNFTKYGSNPILTYGGGSTWNEKGVWAPFVIYDGEAGLWKMWHTGMDGSNEQHIGYATASSPLGPWTEYGSNPIIDATETWEGTIVSAPSVLRRASDDYVMLYHGNEPASSNGRIGLATSTDGISWTKEATNPVIDPSGSGWMAASVFSPRTLYYEDGTYYVYFSAKQTGGGFSKSGGASSTDLLTWTMFAANPLITSTRTWEGGGSGETETPNAIRIGHDWYIFYDAWFGSPATIGVIKVTV